MTWWEKIRQSETARLVGYLVRDIFYIAVLMLGLELIHRLVNWSSVSATFKADFLAMHEWVAKAYYILLALRTFFGILGLFLFKSK